MQKTEMFSSFDGTKLFLSRDIPESPKAVIVLAHGLGYHIGFFNTTTAKLNSHNIAVYRFDHRGFGRSEGKKAYVKSFNEIVNDIDEIVNLAKSEYPGLPIFLLGHSMGGHTVALYGMRKPSATNGTILCAPFLRYYIPTHGHLPRREDPESYIPMADALFGSLHSPGEDLFEMLLKSDPLMADSCSISLLNALGEGAKLINLGIKKFTDPLLIINGDKDACISPREALDFYWEVPSEDKSLRIYANTAHGLWLEPAGDMIEDDIVNWIEHRIK